MKETWNFDSCVSVLTGEIELLRKITAAQHMVRQAVINKEWTDFDERAAEVNRLGEEFALLEDERILLFSALHNSFARENNPSDTEERPFYALITYLPVEETRVLSQLYRELKMETHKMRSINESLLIYINEAKTMAAAYLEAVCPARGGKLYTRKGRRVSQDLKSMVYNNHF